MVPSGYIIQRGTVIGEEKMSFGTVAGVFTTGAFLPQVIKICKTRDVRSISLGMYCIQVIGLLLWIIHGFVIKDYSIIIANTITCLFSATILAFKAAEVIKGIWNRRGK